MNNTAWWIIIFILILLILAAGEIYRETHTFRVRKYKVKTKKNIGNSEVLSFLLKEMLRHDRMTA